MSLTLAGVETSIGSAFHAVATKEAAVSATFHKLVAGLDAMTPELIAAITALFGPTGGAAGTAIIGIINAVDAADTAVNAAAAGGVSLSLPAELMAVFRSAKTSILSEVKAL